MIHYKAKEEIELIKEGAEVLGRVHGELAALIRPGLKTIELDTLAEEFIRAETELPAVQTLAFDLSEDSKIVQHLKGRGMRRRGTGIVSQALAFFEHDDRNALLRQT